MPDAPMIALAGASGDLGERIAKALVARGATVHALVRPDLNADEGRRIEATGAALVEADPADLVAMAEACAGAKRGVSIGSNSAVEAHSRLGRFAPALPTCFTPMPDRSSGPKAAVDDRAAHFCLRLKAASWS